MVIAIYSACLIIMWITLWYIALVITMSRSTVIMEYVSVKFYGICFNCYVMSYYGGRYQLHNNRPIMHITMDVLIILHLISIL